MEYFYKFYVDEKLRSSCGYKKKEYVEEIMTERYGKGNFEIEKIEIEEAIREKAENLKELLGLCKK